MVRNLKEISAFIIYIFPFLIVSGPFLSDFALVLISLIFLFISYKEKNFKLFKNKYFQIFIIFYFYILLRSLFTFEWMSIKSALFYIRFGIFALAINYFLQNNIISLKFFLYSLCILLLVLFFDSSYQYFFKVNTVGIPIYHDFRISSFFGDELVMGSFSFRVLILCIPLIIFYYPKKILYLPIVLVLISLIIILSGERTALGLFIIFFIFLIYVLLNSNKLRIISMVIFGSILLVIFYFNENLRKRIIDTTISNFVFEKKFMAFSQMHMQHYNSALNMFKFNPIFGVGPKMYRLECADPKYSNYQILGSSPKILKNLNPDNAGEWACSTHPHNIVIQFLAELGLIGAVFLFYFYYILIKKILSNLILVGKINHKSLILLQFLILLNFFPFFPYGNFLNNWLSIMNIFSISLIGFIDDRKFKSN